MLAERGMSVGDFAEAIGITPANVTVLKNGRAKAVRFTTLDAICHPHGCARRAALAEELVAEAEQWLGLPLRAPAQGAGTAGLGRGWPTSPKSTRNQAKVAEVDTKPSQRRRRQRRSPVFGRIVGDLC